MDKIVLVGIGEVGKSIYHWMKDTYVLAIQDPFQGYNASGTYDTMLVAIPYTEHFVTIVKEYQEKFNPTHTIVFSSTAIGTCEQLGAIHIPIEGRHPKIDAFMKASRIFIGGDTNGYAFDFIYEITKNSKFPQEIYTATSSKHTEFLKLRSTTLYGMNIEFARYSKKVCDEIGLDYEAVKTYDENYNEVYNALGFPEFSRYILNPPEGKIGGHCVVPNAKILFQQFPDPLLKPLINNNE